MLAWIRSTKDLGNDALYVRLRGIGANIGKFYDWVDAAWVTPETADCKQFLTEYPDSDTLESLFAKEVTLPSAGAYVMEVVNDDTGLVEGSELTDRIQFDSDDNVKSAPQTAVTINPVEVSTGVLNRVVTVVEEGLIRIKRGDAAPREFVLGTQWDLTGKKVYFCMKQTKTGTAKVNRACTITDAANGICSFVFTTAETDTVGTYYAELEVRNEDDTSPLTAWEGRIEIVQDVRQ